MGAIGVYDGIMNNRTGCWGLVFALGMAGLSGAQTLSNQTLMGKYYFRHVSPGTDAGNPANLTDPRSLIGSITFDGAGKYSFSGQQVTGTGAATAASGSGNYAVDPGGSSRWIIPSGRGLR
jgi:hypothetical protein